MNGYNEDLDNLIFDVLASVSVLICKAIDDENRGVNNLQAVQVIGAVVTNLLVNILDVNDDELLAVKIKAMEDFLNKLSKATMIGWIMRHTPADIDEVH